MHTSQIIFAIQLLIAEFVFTAYQEKKEHFALRLAGSIAGYFLLAVFFPQISYGWLIPVVPVIFLAATLILFMCFEQTPSILIYCSCGAYCIQHISMNVTAILSGLLGLSDSPSGILASHILSLFCMTAIYGLAFFIIPRRTKYNKAYTTPIWMSVTVSMLVFVINFVLCSIALADGYRSYYVLQLYATLCSMLILFFQYMFLAYKQADLDWQNMEQLFFLRAKQETAMQENIELINLKCHDLKKYLSLLKEKQGDKHDVAQIEAAVFSYENLFRTGNEVLDTILTSKNLMIEKYGIHFSCVIEPVDMEFMSYVDQISLFGNIIDNAIENVSEEAEAYRTILFSIKKRGSYIYIHSENYCSRQLQFENGLPLPRENSSGLHGYGLKSIKYLVEKYSGKFQLRSAEQMFSVNILLPDSLCER